MSPNNTNLENDSSFEFDMFESMRRVLAGVYVDEGRDAVEAERIAFYVIQGVRGVPKLLAALADRTRADEEILSLVDAVVENAASLEKARSILYGLG